MTTRSGSSSDAKNLPIQLPVRAVVGLLTAVLPLVGSAPARAQALPEVVIDGKGWGHGVGMAQDGAYSMGMAGSDTAEILGHFYPGTELGEASGPIRVEVRASAPGAVLGFPDGGEVLDAPSGQQSPGFPVAVQPGGEVELSFDGSTYTARPLAGAILHESADAPAASAPDPGATSSAEPPPPAADSAQSGRGLLAVPAEGATVALPERDRRYRGFIEALGDSGGLRLMNEVDVEDYLKGMGEVRDPGWPAAGLRAQAVAARTYALRAMARGGQICDTDRCQVYLGEAVEYGAMNQAVADTAGQVLTYGGALALTVYSANAGGFSATPSEGWGGGDDASQPYLRAAPYLSTTPDLWTKRYTLADLSGRFGGRGEPTTARVSRTGLSGRALEVTIDGSDGPVAIDGHRFASELGLRSNFFTLRMEGVPPPAAAPEQVTAAAAPAAASTPPAPFPVRSTEPDEHPSRAPWIAVSLMLVVAILLAGRVAGARGP